MNLSRERLLLLVLAAVTAAVWWFAWQERDDRLRVTVLDVGQGDCILVEAPGGRTMLVDGGGTPGHDANGYDIGREVVVPALMARGVTKIDALVITHPHDDHIGGLPAVVDSVPVGLAVEAEIESDSQTHKALESDLAKHHVKVEHATEGARLNLGRDIYAEVLNPPATETPAPESAANDDSLVLRLVDGNVSILLAGDIERAGAERLAADGSAIQSAILKVPHHGSAWAAMPEFVDAVSPKLAIISVGENNTFGHPSDEMLRELGRVGAKVMRTDRDGAVTVTIRPPKWWCSTAEARR